MEYPGKINAETCDLPEDLLVCFFTSDLPAGVPAPGFGRQLLSTRILFSLCSALDLKALPLYLLSAPRQTQNKGPAHPELVSPRRDTIEKQKKENK